MTWKLQELTKKEGVPLIISGSVATLVSEHFDLRGLGGETIDKSHQAWEIFTVEGPAGESRPAVEKTAAA